MSNLKTIRYSQFFHRRNADATIDSICGVCFLTVSSAVNEEEVRAQEAYHRCPDRKSVGLALAQNDGPARKPHL
jgi:hypothetical protein